ncbi:MAG: SAM-dependent methyltransferase [Hydrogenophaga sp.]|uniref:class I SAM-dependent methyltransferase n=1 Tax=Hydrogenophaga sp. TaxID=1904254 RepID=UPI003D0AC779
MAKHKAHAQAAPTLHEQLPELRPGQSVALLQELHILTREGRLNQDTRRKLKQVYHLVQFIEPLLAEVLAARGDVILADHGAGKSYLGFILYDLFFKDKTAGRVTGVETRAELVDKSRELAERLGFARMDFLATTVQQALNHPELPERIDVVTALHACDTATDDAIAFGLAKDASHLVLVPCCQAEVAGVMRKHKALSLARTPLAELWRHPLHTREFGSQITNVLRCLQLEAHGYSVTVTELVGWEHSLKNELILARRMVQDRNGARERARLRLRQVLDELDLQELTQRFAV